MKALLLCLGIFALYPALSAQNSLLVFRNSAFMDAQLMSDREDTYGTTLSTGIASAYAEGGWLDTYYFNILDDSRRFFENPFDAEINYYNLIGEKFDLAMDELKLAKKQNEEARGKIKAIQYPFLKICRPNLPDNFAQFQKDTTIVLRVMDDIACMNYEIRMDKARKRRAGIPQPKYIHLQSCIDGLPETYEAFKNDDEIIVSDSDYLCFMVAAGWTVLDPNKPCYFDPISGIALDLDDDGQPDCDKATEHGIDSDEELSELEIDEMPRISASESIASPIGAAAKPLSMTSILVDGAARFLVERVQQELTLAFYDKLMERMNKVPELQKLFPSTFLILKNQEYFRVPSMGEVWLGAFETDIKSFVPNFQKMVNEDSSYVSIKNDVAFQMLGVVYTVGDGVQQSRPFIDIVEDLSPLAENETPVGNSIKFVQLILSNLSENDGNDNLKLASAQSFRGLDSQQKRYFMGLLFQKEEALFDSLAIGNTSVASFMQDNYQNINLKVGELLNLVESFETRIGRLKAAKEKETPSKSEIRSLRIELTELGFGVIDFGFSMTYFSDPGAYNESDLFRFLDQFSGNVRNVTIAIEEDELGLAFLHTLHTVVPILESRVKKLKAMINDSSKVAVNKKIERLAKVTHFINFYGGFMIDMLNAESAEQIKELINKYAMPVGSFRIKRKSKWAIELNAFPGLYTGWEFNDEANGGTSGVTGITAPIGFSVSKGIKGFSYSLFIPIVDIGAAFSYRWTGSNDTQGFPENIQWQQILSPGAHFVVGLKQIPISFMAGAQFTPMLRGINDDALELVPQSAWRFGFGAVVDIPIAKFYQQNRAYRAKDQD